MEVHINILAIVVSAVAVFLVSFFWYGPLFGKAWMKSAGMGELTPEMKAAGMKKMPLNSIIQLIGTLLMSLVFAHVIAFGGLYFNETGIMAAIKEAFLMWIGFVAPVTIGMVLWEGRPWKYWFIVAGNWLVNLLLIGVILGGWM